MAKITFIQPLAQTFVNMFYLCGAVKAKSHHYSICVSSSYSTIKSHIARETPDIIGFTVFTGLHTKIIDIAKKIKKDFSIPIILGGAHPTFFPEVLHNHAVDMICVGEGEFALIELLDCLDAKKDYSKILNLHIKQGGKIIRNDLRPLIDPLDEAPFPDYTVYNSSFLLSRDNITTTFAIRGCPYNCSYCFNVKYRELYKGKGASVRYCTVNRVLSEIESALECRPYTKHISLGADCFGIDYEWSRELIESYSIKFRIPFSITLRPEVLTKRLVKVLAQAKCKYVAFGIESGNEELRKRLLHRNYSNDKIYEVASLLQKYNIKFRTYNIVGFPGETKEQVWDTISLNMRIKPDLPWCSIFTPYPGTELGEHARQKGYLSKEFSYDCITSYHDPSIVVQEHRDYLNNAHDFFQSIVRWQSLCFLWKCLLKMRSNIIFNFWHKIVFTFIKVKGEKMPFTSLIYFIYGRLKK